jgi:hypothetical protein
MSDESGKSRHTVLDWLALYVGLVIILHLLVVLVVIAYWPANSPISVWDLLTGIVASALVATLAGIVTITISAKSSHDLEIATVNAITRRVQARLGESLSAPVTSDESLSHAILSLLRQADDPTSPPIVLVELDPSSQVWNEDILSSLNERIRRNMPTWLILPLPEWLCDPKATIEERDRAFWSALLRDITPEERFDDRQFYICPVAASSRPAAARLDAPSSEADLRALSGSVIALTDVDEPGTPRLGLRTAIDEHVCTNVITGLCSRILEPASTYADHPIMHHDLQRGILTGIPITRSLITSQILIAAKHALTLAAGANGTRGLHVEKVGDGPGVQVEFRYAGSMFLPPTKGKNPNHSGSVLAALLASGPR